MEKLLSSRSLTMYDPKGHYSGFRYISEAGDLAEAPMNIKNIGWTLGNDCPYRCNHCYSMSARKKGEDLSKDMIERVVDQIVTNGIETVNLGGNEPLYTNGLNPRATLLPFIIRRLSSEGVEVGLTSSGITVNHLADHHPVEFRMLNDCDISLDSPYPDEHNNNRGARLFDGALRALDQLKDAGIERSIIMCAMNWNFTSDRLQALVGLAKRFSAYVRINPLKVVDPVHQSSRLGAAQYYAGFSQLMQTCDMIDLGEPPIAAISRFKGARGCPCGRTSFRIHSITPDGRIPVSPCVYLHDFKVGDLLTEDLADIVRTEQFKDLRRRNENPSSIEGCVDCEILHWCRGGCAARGYLEGAHSEGRGSLFQRDPYCPIQHQPGEPFPDNPRLHAASLVHSDYLCTWIGRPKTEIP